MFYEPSNGHGLPHNPFKAIVAPRPIAWISTLSKGGEANLAPYSFFNAVSDDPPIVLFSQSPAPDRDIKDTLANVLMTQEFVIHIVPEAMQDAMNVSSAPLPHGVDEFERAGLAKAPSMVVAPPRIADAPIALECRFLNVLGLPGGTSKPGAQVVFGEVVGVHIDDAVLEDGILKVERYAPLARLGYRDYSAVHDTFSLTRPKT